MKYFLVGAFVSGLLIYGIALIGMKLRWSTSKRAAMSRGAAPLFYVGWMLLLVSFAFKLGVVPFHVRGHLIPTKERRRRSPGFMMSCIKAAGFAGLIRFLQGTLPMLARDPFTGWTFVLSWLAVLTMSLGNLAALKSRTTSSACWRTRRFRTRVACWSVWCRSVRSASRRVGRFCSTWLRMR